MKQKEVINADSLWLEKPVFQFPGSPSERIGKGWMLISAGDVSSDKSNWNTMTASWGGLGVLWGRDVAFIFIRPGRRTFELANPASLFSLSFFDESRRKALKICGEQSGRDIDKAAVAGLTPMAFEDGAIGFKESKEVLVCRKLYYHDLDPNTFIDAHAIETHYPDKDYHRMFVGEIIRFMVRS